MIIEFLSFLLIKYIFDKKKHSCDYFTKINKYKKGRFQKWKEIINPIKTPNSKISSSAKNKSKNSNLNFLTSSNLPVPHFSNSKRHPSSLKWIINPGQHHEGKITLRKVNQMNTHLQNWPNKTVHQNPKRHYVPVTHIGFSQAPKRKNFSCHNLPKKPTKVKAKLT